MHISTIRGSVPKCADHDIIVCSHTQSERRSRRHTDTCSKVARDPWYDVESEGPSKGNRAPLIITVRLTKHLSNKPPKLSSSHQVDDKGISVMRSNNISRPKVAETSYDYRFLS